jgi:hypothetical protein
VQRGPHCVHNRPLLVVHVESDNGVPLAVQADGLAGAERDNAPAIGLVTPLVGQPVVPLLRRVVGPHSAVGFAPQIVRRMR